MWPKPFSCYNEYGTFSEEKSRSLIWPRSEPIFQKNPKVNNHNTGENSTNLVTLATTQQLDSIFYSSA
jgi:hypothetical protein